MTYFQTGVVFRIIILMPFVSFLTVSSATSGAQETVGVTEVTPELLVFATAAGNVVASVGPDGALLVGTPAAASTPFISNVLASRTKSAVRYVVIAPQDIAHSQGPSSPCTRMRSNA